MKVKRILTSAATATAAVAVLLVAGCSSSQSGKNSSANSNAPSAAPIDGGEAIIGASTEPTTLNPDLTTAQDTQAVAGLWAQGLTYLDANFVPKPELATSWEVSPDGLTYTYHLRQGVKWSDGQPFTSEDVVWTLTQGVKNLANAKLALGANTKVTALDDHTVQIVLAAPSAVLPTILSKAVVKILPAHLYSGADLTTNPANLAPVGTGPFVFEKWDKGKSISFVKNPNYWGGAPHLDRVSVNLVSDPTAAVNALRTGEIDYFAQLPDASVSLAQAGNGLTVDDAAGVFPTQAFLAFNTKKGPTADAAVRRAITQAVDRKQWTDTIYSRNGHPGVGPISPAFTGRYDPKVTYDSVDPFNVAAANSALDAAGYPKKSGGTRFSLRFRSGTDSQSLAAGELLRSQLAAIGIAVTIDPVERAATPTTVYTNFDFDIFFQTYYDADPVFLLNRQYGCKSVGVQFGNLAQYCSPTVDDAIAGILASKNSTEYNAAISKATKAIVTDLPYLVVANPANKRAWRSKLQGVAEFRTTSVNWPDWSKVWIAK